MKRKEDCIKQRYGKLFHVAAEERGCRGKKANSIKTGSDREEDGARQAKEDKVSNLEMNLGEESSQLVKLNHCAC